jgi:hypothetical protein
MALSKNSIGCRHDKAPHRAPLVAAQRAARLRGSRQARQLHGGSPRAADLAERSVPPCHGGRGPDRGAAVRAPPALPDTHQGRRASAARGHQVPRWPGAGAQRRSQAGHPDLAHAARADATEFCSRTGGADPARFPARKRRSRDRRGQSLRRGSAARGCRRSGGVFQTHGHGSGNRPALAGAPECAVSPAALRAAPGRGPRGLHQRQRNHPRPHQRAASAPAVDAFRAPSGARCAQRRARTGVRHRDARRAVRAQWRRHRAGRYQSVSRARAHRSTGQTSRWNSRRVMAITC